MADKSVNRKTLSLNHKLLSAQMCAVFSLFGWLFTQIWHAYAELELLSISGFADF